MTGSRPALDGLLRAVDAAEPYLTVVTGPPPQGGEGTWVAIADLVDAAGPALDEALAAAIAACAGAPDAGAAYLAGWVGELLAGPAYLAAASAARTWVVAAPQLWIRRTGQGWYDGLAVDGAIVRVLADDHLAGIEGTIAHADRDELMAALASDLVAVLGPLFAAIRRRAPFGVRGMWGTTADAIVTGAAHRALREGHAERDAIAGAELLLDHLTAAGAPAHTRPATFTVSCRQRDVTAVRKGTCCLWYKTVPDDGATDDPEGRYCLACPLVAETTSDDRWRTWLETELDAAGLAP